MPATKPPWDARLVAWMSRSSAASGGVGRRPLSPGGLAFYAVWFGSLGVLWGHSPWYGVAMFVAVVAVWSVARVVRKRRGDRRR
jgi:hypothetical protein